MYVYAIKYDIKIGRTSVNMLSDVVGFKGNQNNLPSISIVKLSKLLYQ